MDQSGNFLETIRATLQSQKKLAERAMSQLEGGDLHWAPHPESNSIAIIVKHLAGNMRSRWTDFLSSDGEKPTRNRDGEFVDDLGDEDEIMAVWEQGWAVLFSTLSELRPTDLQRKVTVGGKELTAVEALLGQLAHYAQHVGQIVYLAKLRLGDGWETVSIPKKRTDTA
ncbi:MAG TPA: DUF1572 family protein [Trueperaceae bacterium]